MRTPARRPDSAHGSSFIGLGTAFRASSRRLRGTIIVAWGEGQDEPWIILTDLAPSDAGASWREMRFWIETGFDALKSVGWQWQKTPADCPRAGGASLDCFVVGDAAFGFCPNHGRLPRRA